MSHIDFEADGVDYRLFLSTHLKETEEIVLGNLDCIDALVLEGMPFTEETYKEKIKKAPIFVDKTGEESILDLPLYSVDTMGKKLYLKYFL